MMYSIERKRRVREWRRLALWMSETQTQAGAERDHRLAKGHLRASRRGGASSPGQTQILLSVIDI